MSAILREIVSPVAWAEIASLVLFCGLVIVAAALGAGA